MGLDQYVYRVKKPSLEQKVYTTDEIRNLGLASVFVDGVKCAEHLYEQILPYVVERDISAKFYDVEKIIADYNLPKNSSIGCISGTDGITLYGTDSNGNYIRHTVSNDEINEKYIITRVTPSYIWEETEVAYWRKDYALQDWIYNIIEGIDNTGYYVLDAEIIRELNHRFDTHIKPQDPTSKSALFYWEWY